ncbi:prenyltransferase [Halobacteriales archaeon QH_2_66_30]|nr:MAG: prenyltransferase [Halobacteriales archaeon QH_2_66_30]
MSHFEQSTRTDNPLAQALLFLVHSNLLISTAATSIAVATMVLVDLPVRPVPLFIVFAVTMFVYSFNRLADFAEDRQNVPDRAAFVSRYGKVLLAAGIVMYLAAGAFVAFRGVPGAPALALPLVIALLYSTVGLKRILLVKNLLVGIAWGLIPTGVGVYYGQFPDAEILFVAGFVTAILTIAAVVFDIKDIEGDSEEGIQTVPVLVGPAWTRRLAAAAAALLGATVAGVVAADVFDPIYAVLTGYAGYVAGYSLFATRERGPLFYGFVIDSEQIWFALALIAIEYVLPAL